MAFLSIERASKYSPLQDGTPGRTGRQESFCVFRDVDLRIDRGEFVTLIGHSGCGKSTLLNIVVGFEQASAGSVILYGRGLRRGDEIE
jgi:nitrate/nitrite transport system ATP-binding protein